MIINRTSISLFLLAQVSFSVNAQKLPKIQENSLRAPVNIKIDGRATDWNNKFQAYNKQTGIFYSIANDDNNLYLAVQAKDPTIINKIILGGITCNINSSGKKNDKNAVSITFPKYDKSEGQHSINIKNKPEPTNDTLKNSMQADSFMHIVNKRLTAISKLIGVTGVKTITDSLISVYNDDGIKAVSLFDKQINYTYELAIPLKYLGLSINKPRKISYQIMLEGASANNATIQLSGGGRFLNVTVGNNPPNAIPAVAPYLDYVYPTDFWGEYTLAKK